MNALNKKAKERRHERLAFSALLCADMIRLGENMANSRQRAQRGFTLIELGIVIAVMAVLAAIVLPDMIEGMRTRMIQKVVDDISLLQDAARAYHSTDRDSTATDRLLWPMEENYGVSCPEHPGNVQQRLANTGFLADAPLLNPWGQPYIVDVVASGTGGAGSHQECQFVVTTGIPFEDAAATALSISFERLATFARCESIAGLGTCPNSTLIVDSGFTACCSYITRPSGALGGAQGPCPPGQTVQLDSNTFKCM